MAETSKDYRTLSSELDATIARLQQHDVDVEEAVKLYEHGLKLITQLEGHLKQVENKFKKLKLADAKQIVD